ncbi:MAG: FG-GAP-like repeat-containing protein [Elusimicrobiota bacterium]|jgi:hypothetical protein
MTLKTAFQRILLAALAASAAAPACAAGIPPDAVTDLRVASIVSTGLNASSMTVTLQWTAPGEDASLGVLNDSTFSLRYSLAAIPDDAAYDAASFVVDLATSGVEPGSLRTAQIQNLSATTSYYFVLKTTDSEKLTAQLSVAATAPSYRLVQDGTQGDSYSVAWGDADNDGRLDLAISNYGGAIVLQSNNGDGSFTTDWLTGAAKNSYGIAWGDLNGDGWLDLAVANAGAQDEMILWNNGDGTFTNTDLAGTAGDSRGIAVGDYDNDGRLDIVVSNYGSTIMLLRNNGDRTFTQNALAGTSGNNVGIAWGDYNNDGKLDLAVARNGGQNAVILRNDGNGVFTALGGVPATGGNSYSVAWGDYDGNGTLDLVVGQNGLDEGLLRNNGNGTFTSVGMAGSAAFTYGVAWGDFNNDGRLDVALGNYAQDKAILRNDGGSFTKVVLPVSNGSTIGVSWGDADGNGTLDLAAANYLSEDEFVLRNDTGSVLHAPSAPATGFAASFAEYSAFSSSGILTLFWGDAYDVETPTAALRYFVRVGTTVAGSSTTYKLPARYGLDGYSGGGSSLYSTRVSSSARGLQLEMQRETTVYWSVVAEDGGLLRSAESAEQIAGLAAPGAVTDLRAVSVSTGLGASSVTVMLQWTSPGEDGYAGALAGAVYEIRYSSVEALTSTDTYMAAPLVVTIPTTTAAGQPQSAYFTGLDAMATYYFTLTTRDRINVRSSLSNATTAYPFIVRFTASGGDARGIAWGDCDGDGWLDALVTNSGSSVWLARNDRAGGFTVSALAGTSGNARGVAWGDYDNDGLLDAAVGLANGGGGVLLMTNTGDCGFTSGVLPLSAGQDVRGVAWGDYDNDGRLDLAVAVAGAAGDFVMRQEADLSFSSAPLGGTTYDSQGVAWGDYDNDGYLDLVFANYSNQKPVLVRNRGDGGFNAGVQVGAANLFGHGVAWGDYNNDGKLDFIVAVEGDEVLYRNDGGGAFTAISITGVGGTTVGLGLADYNNDGRLDFALGNAAGETKTLVSPRSNGTYFFQNLPRTGAASQGVSWGDYNNDGKLDLAVANGGGVESWILRNDTGVVTAPPAVPTGFSASFEEYASFSSSGVVTLTWNDSTDAVTSTAAMRYFVRVGTTVAGSSTTYKLPARYGLDGYSGGGSFLYSTKVSSTTRGLRLLGLSKETTIYWAVEAENGGLVRSAESAEQTSNLSAPAAVGDLAAVQDSYVSGVETSSTPWISLSWTIPGEDGWSTPLGGSTRYDVRWSTWAPIAGEADYMKAVNQMVLSASGDSPGGMRTQIISGAVNTTYYFAMTTLDSNGVRSGLSNVASVLPATLRINIDDVTPTSALQNNTTAFLRVRLWTHNGSVSWTKLRIRRIGTLADAMVKNAAVYQDFNGNGVFDSGDLPAMRTLPAAFVSSAAAITFSPVQSIGASTKTYFVALQLDNNYMPVDGATVAVRLDAQAFTIKGGGIDAPEFPGVQLDGVSGRISAPYKAVLNPSKLTVEAWVRTTDDRIDRSIVTRASLGGASGWRLWLNGGGCGAGVPTLLIGTDVLCANKEGVPVSIADGAWHHIAGAYHPIAGKRVYVDGIMLSTEPATGALSDITSDLGVGGANSHIGNSLLGEIDDVRISNEYRYATSFVPTPRADIDGNTVVLYHFDNFGGTGTVVTDTAANDDGVLQPGAVGFGRSTSTVVVDAQDLMLSTAVSAAPPTLYRNAVNIPMLKLQFWTAQDFVTINQVSIKNEGSGSPAGVTNIRFCLDNGNGVYEPALDTALTLGQDFTIDKATFDLVGEGKSQLISHSTKTYFLVWDVTGGADLNQTLGVSLSTQDFVLNGGTDAVSTVDFPLISAVAPVLSASAFVYPETTTGTWVNVSSVVFTADFSLGNVNHFHYLFDRIPNTSISGVEPMWTTGKATVTATTDANDWWFHVRAFDALDVAGSQQDIGPFYIDRTLPGGASFSYRDSTGGVYLEGQVIDLASPVTAQITVQDALSGLAPLGPAPLAPGPGTLSLWHLDDASGIVWRDSGTLNISVSSVGVVTRAAGRFAAGVYLDGGGDLRNAAPTGLPTGSRTRTVEAWINPVSTQGANGIVTWGSAGALNLQRLYLNNGRLAVDMGGGPYTPGAVLSTGVWQHVAFSYDGIVGTLYVDGNAIGSNSFGAASTALGTLYIGNTESGGRFKGWIDEVRVLARAMDSGEARDDAVRGHPYYVAYSSTAGNAWQVVVATVPGSGAFVGMTGSQGSTAAQTLSVSSMSLNVSTSNAVGALATNQVLFYVADRSGNYGVAGPYGVVLDSNTAVAVSTPNLPADGSYTGTMPYFQWTGPSTTTVTGMGGPGGSNGRFYLQVSANDPDFAPGSIVLSISTPALVSDTGISRVTGVYLSTHALVEGNLYYQRVRSLSSLGVYGPWSSSTTFRVDKTTPTASLYRLFNSTGGALSETQYTNLTQGSSAQIVLDDNLSGFTNGRELPVIPGTRGLWHFSEREGHQPVDSSGRGNSGTMIGVNASSAAYGVTPFGVGLRCDGLQAMDVAGADFDFAASTAFTFEFWMNPDYLSGTQVIGGVGSIFPPGGNWLLRLSDDRLFFTNNTAGGYLSPAGFLNAGIWQHVAMVVRGTRIKFYVNGVLVNTGISPAGGNGGPYGRAFTLCAANRSTGQRDGLFTGALDEVRVLDYAAESSQIADDYAFSRAGRWAVEVSSNAGTSWGVVSATWSSAGWPYIALSGAEGSVGPETLAIRNLSLTHSTSSAVGALATNQVRFNVPDRAGNMLVSGPYGLIVDTVAAAAVSTPAFPVNGAYVRQQPNFIWNGPSTTTAAGMGKLVFYRLEVDVTPNFNAPVVSVSTPVIIQSTSAAYTFADYLSTYTLVNNATYYWRVTAQDFLGQRSPPLSVASFVTDFSAPADSAFRSLSSTGGATAENTANDIAVNVTAAATLMDSVSGLQVTAAGGRTSYGVVYSTDAGATWYDGGVGDSYLDASISTMTALVAFQNRLYAAASGSGGSVGKVFVYDGASWSQSQLFGAEVRTLKEYANKLYAGLGDGTVYTFDGFAWTGPLATLDGRVNAFAEYNGRFYAGTGPAGRIWVYDPQVGLWYPSYKASDPEIHSLEVYNNRLFAGGNPNVYGFDGSSWTVSLFTGGATYSLKTYANRLYAGTNLSGRIYSYDGGGWGITLDLSEIDAHAVESFGGRLYAGANDASSPGRLYAYDGKGTQMIMHTFPTVNDRVYAFGEYNGRLYMGGADSSFSGKVWVSTPLPVSLTGTDGTMAAQTVAVTGLDLAQSLNASVCAGVAPCAATNQVRFAAVDRAGGVAAAGPFAILVDPLLSPPTALYPASGAFIRTSTPTLVWIEQNAMPLHDVYISSQPGFVPLSAQSLTSNPSYLSPMGLTAATTYYWRVRGQDAIGIYSGFSASPIFQIDQTAPSVLDFRHFSSTEGALGQGQYTSLTTGVTVQVTVQDLDAGIDRGPALRTIDGTKALVPFDEGQGGAVTSIDGGMRMLFSGAADWAPGLVNFAARFDGASSLASTGTASLPAGDTARTVELWVYPENANGGGLIEYGGNFRLHMSGDCLSAAAGNSLLCLDQGNDSAFTFTPNAWHHIAYTYDGLGHNTLYADGGMIGSFIQSHATGFGRLFVGTATACGPFTGRIEELRVLDRALTAAEVSADYRQAGRIRASYSVDGGANWTLVSATAPVGGVRVAVSGGAGSRSAETVSLEGLSLVQSTTTATGGAGTDQVRFYIDDQAGNETVAGPYTVLVDTTVPQPSVATLFALSTTSLYTAVSATDSFSGIRDFQFETSSSSIFAPPVSTSPYTTSSTYSFTGLAAATTYYVRVRARDNLLNVSPVSVALATSTFGTVYFTTGAIAPASAMQNSDVPMLRFALAAPPASTSKFYSLRVRRSGTVPDAGIVRASIYNDSNGNGVFDGGVEVELAGAAFTAGEAFIDLASAGNTQNIDPSSKTYFLVYRMQTDAPPTATIGVDTMTPYDFSLQFPSSPEGPFPTYVTPIPVTDGPNGVNFTATNIAPAAVQAAQADVPLLRLLAQADSNGTSIMDQVVVRLVGTLPGNQLTGLTLWYDKLGLGTFDKANDDKLSDGATFSNGYSTLTLNAPVSSRTVTSAPAYYFLTANVGISAPQGSWFQVALSTPPDVILDNPADTVSFATLPLMSSTATVVVNNLLRISATDQTPASFIQGDLYSVVRASMAVDIGFAQLNRVTVDRTGTAQDSDLTNASVYRDQTADGNALNPSVDIFLGSAPFVAGRATIDITTSSINQGTTAVFFIAYQLSPGANPGRTLGASLTNASYFRVPNAQTVVTSTFPITTGTRGIVATVNQLLIPLAQSAAPGGADQGGNDIPMLRLDLVSSRNNFSWLSLIVNSSGTALDADVRNVRVYRDDGDGVFSSGADTAITDSSQSFTGGSVNIPLSIPQTITASTHAYFITVSLMPSAVPGRTIGVRISSTSSFNLSSPNFVSSQTATFPFDGGPVVINQFANTVTVTTVSVASILGATPGTQDVALMALTLRTDVSNAGWTTLKVDQAGSAIDADFGDVKVYYDVNNVGAFDSSNLTQYLLITSTGQRFGQGMAGSITLGFNLPPTLGTTPQRYFVTVDLSTAATPGRTVVLRAINETYLAVTAPNQVGPTSFASQPLTVNAPPAQMHILALSSAPANVTQGSANVPMMVLKTWMSAYTGAWTQLRLDRSGFGLDADVTGVKLFRDANGNGTLDVVTDERLSTAAFSAGTAVLSFATQTVTASTQTFFLTYDVSVTAVAGHTIGAIFGAPGLFNIAAPNSVSGTDFPLQSAESVVMPTQAGLYVGGQDKAPGQLTQGATNQLMMTLSLNTSAYAVLWSGLTLRSSGTASDADIKAVHVWRDVNGNSLLEPGTDQDLSSGLNGFLGGAAIVSLTVPQTIGTSQARYLITIDVGDYATPGRTFGLALDTTAAFTLNDPNTVVPVGFPFTSTTIPIKKQPEQLVVSASNLLSSGINQGALSAVVLLNVRASRNIVNWTNLRLARTGTLGDAGAGQIRVYRDLDGSGAVSAPDLLVGTGTFAAGSSTILLSSAQAVGVATQSYVLAFAVDAAATIGATLGCTFSDSGFFTVASPDGVSSSGLPFSTPLASILDARTPQTPVVAVDGPFTSQFEYLHFNWTSSVAAGTLSGAFYSVGTTAGAADIVPFTPLSAAMTDVQATGFVLRTGSTYYITVKTQSDSGYFSQPGTSIGVLVDFTVPPAPTPVVTVGQSTLLVNWGSVPGGPSGISGYIIEYRKGGSPLWLNAKTGTTSKAAHFAPTAVKNAGIPVEELVTGVSYQAVGMPSGTLYMRMRAVTGAGVASAPSPEIKAQVGGLPPEGISSVSNYPNPFDSRKTKTTITYALSAPADVTMRVYSVFGGLVFEKSYGAGSPGGSFGTNEITWDGAGSSGQKVSKGIYLCVLQSGGAKVILKIGVIH